MFYSADKSNVHGVGGVTLRQAIPRRDRLWIFYPKLLQLNLLLTGALACNITNGFDNSMLNGLQLLESWQEYFGNPEGAKLGLIAAGNRLGQFGSLIIIAPLIQKLGRRWPILIGSSIVLLGVALQTAAQNRTMFIMGRVVLGFGNNIQQSCCIILISEVAHPDHRPQLTGLTNSVGSIGQIMAAWITYGSASVPGSWSWRLPSLLQAVSSIFQMIMVWFMPESPRWLIGTGREQEARRILTKYHAEGVEDSDIVRFEMTQIQKTLQPDKAKYSSWMEWFRTPANRHRFLIILTLPWMMQWTGNGIISYYLGLLLESVGITEEDTKLKINGGLTITGFVWAILWSLNMDRIGRRKLLLTAMGGIFCALVILTVLSGINQAHDFSMPRLAAGAVAMVWVHQAFYKMAAPTKDPYFMEVSPYSLRAKTAAVTQFGDAGANVFNGFVNPIGLDIIKWRYYLVWVCLVMSHFVIIYLFFPETQNLSLEEVTQLFENSESSDVPDSSLVEKSPADQRSIATSTDTEKAPERIQTV